MRRDHTSAGFERELKELKKRLAAMAQHAEAQVGRAVEAVLRGGDALAEQVIAEDGAIDRDELAIDEQAFLILMRRQPVASDLRFIMMALKIVTDIERIGDLAENMVKRSRDLGTTRPGPVFEILEQLIVPVRQAVHDACEAFVSEDATLAQRVIRGDPEIDRLNGACFAAIIALGAGDSNDVARALALSSISRYLERIGDHATNIAEMVIYSVQGKNVRHDASARLPKA